MMNLLIDIGSTNIKYALSNKRIIRMDSIPFPNPLIDDGIMFEVSAKEIFDIIKSIIDNNRPDNLFISTQMHGYVLMDENHNELTNYISWRDKRSTIDNTAINITSDYGVNMKPNLPRASIEYFKVHDKDLYNRIAHFMTLGSYVVYKLTGMNASHITELSPSGFYNIRLKTKDEQPYSLPMEYYDICVVGKYNGIDVYTPVGDQQASIYGINHKNRYVLNLGTASQICEVSDEFLNGEYESRPFFHGKYLLTMTNMPGSKIIRNGIKNDELLDIYKEALGKLPKKDKMIVTGGLLKVLKDYFKELLSDVELDVEFNEGIDALNGLHKLSLEVFMKKGIMLSELSWANMPVLMKKNGLDFFILDYEHGAFDYSEMRALVMNARLSGIKCIVRLPNNERKDIVKVLDMGADGVLLPMTSTKEDIMKVVKYAKYRPIGERGVSTMRAHTLYNPPSILEYQKIANERTMVFAQIETISGVKNVRDILGVEGVSGFMLGPNDLSDELGILGKKSPVEILDIIKELSDAAGDLGKSSGIITTNSDYLHQAREMGYEYYSIGSELNILDSGYKKIKEREL